MKLTDDVVSLCKKESIEGDDTLWDRLLAVDLSSQECFEKSNEIESLARLTLGRIEKLKESQLHQIWTQSDSARTYVLRHSGPPDYETYTGDKRKDIVSAVAGLAYIDLLLFSNQPN